MSIEKETMAKVIKWFSTGKTGMSSSFIASYLTTGVGIHAYPLDPSDLNRCLMLLDDVPELKTEMYKLARTSDQWASLCNNWFKLESVFNKEVGKGWSHKDRSAVRTYKIMQEILKK